MPVNTQELMRVVAILSDNHNLRVTVQQSLKGGLVTGASATFGGIFLGPIGLALGGIIGGVTSAMWLSEKFKPVSYIILNDMSPVQQARLTAAITTVLNDLRLEDAIAIAPLFLLENKTAQVAVIKTVIEFVTKDMQLQIFE